MTLIPPPQYDVPPAVPVIERVLPYDEAWRICSGGIEAADRPGWGEPRRIKGYDPGCAWLAPYYGKVRCYIVRVDSETVRRHELAHCNGWPKDHPGGHE